MATKKSPQIQFLDLIAAVCEAPRSTVKNTKETYGIVMQTKLNRAQEHKAEPFLEKLGFTKKLIPATPGGSSRGDFSSDIYGSTYIHPNGSEVSAYSYFGYGSATFNITLKVTEEAALAFLAAAK